MKQKWLSDTQIMTNVNQNPIWFSKIPNKKTYLHNWKKVWWNE